MGTITGIWMWCLVMPKCPQDTCCPAVKWGMWHKNTVVGGSKACLKILPLTPSQLHLIWPPNRELAMMSSPVSLGGTSTRQTMWSGTTEDQHWESRADAFLSCHGFPRAAGWPMWETWCLTSSPILWPPSECLKLSASRRLTLPHAQSCKWYPMPHQNWVRHQPKSSCTSK